MKRQSVYLDDAEFKKIKYACEKDNRNISNFFVVSALKRADIIIENCKSAGVNTEKEMNEIILTEDVEDEE